MSDSVERFPYVMLPICLFELPEIRQLTFEFPRTMEWLNALWIHCKKSGRGGRLFLPDGKPLTPEGFCWAHHGRGEQVEEMSAWWARAVDLGVLVAAPGHQGVWELANRTRYVRYYSELPGQVAGRKEARNGGIGDYHESGKSRNGGIPSNGYSNGFRNGGISGSSTYSEHEDDSTDSETAGFSRGTTGSDMKYKGEVQGEVPRYDPPPIAVRTTPARNERAPSARRRRGGSLEILIEQRILEEWTHQGTEATGKLCDWIAKLAEKADALQAPWDAVRESLEAQIERTKKRTDDMIPWPRHLTLQQTLQTLEVDLQAWQVRQELEGSAP